MKTIARLLQAKVNMKANPSKLCCLRCGKPMRFAQAIYRPIGLPKVQTFECKDCGLTVTAEAAAEVLEMAVQFMPA
jgi:hypothetical protein